MHWIIAFILTVVLQSPKVNDLSTTDRPIIVQNHYCAKEGKEYHRKQLKHLSLDLVDSEKDRLDAALPQAMRFLEQIESANAKVLVHCIVSERTSIPSATNRG